jgi:hypothetical protein
VSYSCVDRGGVRYPYVRSQVRLSQRKPSVSPAPHFPRATDACRCTRRSAPSIAMDSLLACFPRPVNQPKPPRGWHRPHTRPMPPEVRSALAVEVLRRAGCRGASRRRSFAAHSHTSFWIEAEPGPAVTARGPRRRTRCSWWSRTPRYAGPSCCCSPVSSHYDPAPATPTSAPKGRAAGRPRPWPARSAGRCDQKAMVR